MLAKVIVLTLLASVALAAPSVVDRSFAVVIPGYFEDGWVGFACLTAVMPGGSPTPVVLQVNFDKVAGGGIALARANNLFARITGSFAWLTHLTGATFAPTCTHTPGQIQTGSPGLTALQGAQYLSANFKQLEFATYLILDVFLSVTPSYLGADVTILRTDAFTVIGPNNVSYLGSNDILEAATQ